MHDIGKFLRLDRRIGNGIRDENPSGVIPGHANGSRECAPDDRLRMNPESRDSGFVLAHAPE
jgi:hypothetical protein